MTPRIHLFLIGLVLGSIPAVSALAEPRAHIRGEISGELRTQLERAIGDVDGAPASRFEARRRARAGVEAAEALLRSEGYYQPDLQDVVEGEETPVAIVRVSPGRRFVLTEPTILWSDPVPDPATSQAADEDIGLRAGAPGRAVDVIAAEGRIVAGLTRRGYADARTEPRRVVVDHATFTMQPEFRIVAGQLVRLDGVKLETSGRTNPAWVTGLAPWTAGDRYDPENVAELERRLLETGVYEGVGVALSPQDQNVEGLRPIIVTLTDRPRRILEAGATFSTAEGSGVDVIQTHYNRFGRADTLRYQARLANIDSRIGADLSLPHWRRPGRTLTLSGALVNEDTNAYRRTAATISANLRQRLGRTSWMSYGVGLDAGRYDESRFDPLTAAPINFNRDLVILTGRASAYIDRSNNPLDPTKGWRMSISAQPTAVSGQGTTGFLRTEAQATAYMPLQADGRTVLAGRLRLGSILGGQELAVPSDRLFFSGGGGSVRGYAYQGVGPRLPDNTPRGGLSLFESSVEIRRDIGNNIGIAAFVDAGSVGFQTAPDLANLRYAAGMGVRYKLPFGPIRADIAFPLDKRAGDASFQLYISIGQAF
ncbi:autotransporter assembly complex family protein [uncultured Brevundimonas sp.]|uniref:autotransporter assembly complex protein TamA n=1 Tax=uncultured Brevundimonas sp. TaxID=213418 RepID=UPI0030EE0DA7